MTERRQLLMQCPGCWSFGLHEEPTDEIYIECECGEGWQVVDLRDPDVWALRMGPPPRRRRTREERAALLKDTRYVR